MDDRDEFGIDLRRRNDRPRFRCTPTTFRCSR